MEKQIKEIMSLSSGTIARLTGFRKYKDIDNVHQKFVLFVARDDDIYENWLEAWFYFRGRG